MPKSRQLVRRNHVRYFPYRRYSKYSKNYYRNRYKRFNNYAITNYRRLTDETEYRFKRTVNINALVLSPNSYINATFSHTFQDMKFATTLGKVFDRYCLYGVKMRLHCYSATSADLNLVAAPAGANPNLKIYHVIDYSDLGSISVDQALTYQSLREWYPLRGDLKRYYPVSVTLRETDIQGSLFDNASIKRRWIDTSDAGARHLGSKLVSDVNNSSHSMLIGGSFIYYFKCKGLGKETTIATLDPDEIAPPPPPVS